MRNYIILIFIFGLNVSAKDCDCLNQFNSIKNVLESNHPYFKSSFFPLDNYKLYLDSINIEINKFNNKLECNFLIREYLEHFNDNNLYINSHPHSKIDESNKNDVFDVINSSDYRNTQTKYISNLNDSNTLIFKNRFYFSFKNKLKIAFTKSDNIEWDFIGFVVDSKSQIWKKSQIKYYIKKINNKFFVKYLNDLHISQFKVLSNFDTDINLIDLYDSEIEYKNDKIFELKNISENFTYINIPTFEDSYLTDFNNFVNKNRNSIINSKYLIIDLRDNNSSGNSIFKSLLSLIAKSKFDLDSLTFYNSNENKASINKIKSRKNNLLLENIFVASNLIINQNKETNIYQDSIISSDSKVFKVFILQNKNTGKDAEKFIYYSLKKFNAINLGESTYGDIAFDLPITYYLNCGIKLTFSSIFNYNLLKFEKNGIQSKIKINKTEDWIEKATNYLNAD